jgi:hypothetical protein
MAVKYKLNYGGFMLGLVVFSLPIFMITYGFYCDNIDKNYEKIYKSIENDMYNCNFESATYYENGKKAIGYGTLRLDPLDDITIPEIIHFGRDGVYLGNNKTSEELFEIRNSRELEEENTFMKKFILHFQNTDYNYFTDCLYNYELGYYHICHSDEAEFLNEEKKYNDDDFDTYCLTNFTDSGIISIALIIFGFVTLLPGIFVCLICSIEEVRV